MQLNKDDKYKVELLDENRDKTNTSLSLDLDYEIGTAASVTRQEKSNNWKDNFYNLIIEKISLSQKKRKIKAANAPM